MPGAGLSDGCTGKALSDMPAFQPYWGKPAVRNDRGDSGNVGIIRSPLRATVLPDCGGRSAMVVPTATVISSPVGLVPTHALAWSDVANLLVGSKA
jgi:hypothetical protein